MGNNWFLFWTGAFAAAFSAVIAAALVGMLFARPLIRYLLGTFIRRLMSDRYSENVWEMVTAMTKINPIVVVENSLRAATGAIIERPFGSPRKFLNFDGLLFSAAQLAALPTREGEDVEMSVTIGPAARKPLKLDIPLLAGAMGYGIGVSETVKKAIARATAAVGTASNSGEGGFLPEERELAKFFIWQYSSGPWSHKPEVLKQADAIEIHLGQGATAGTASIIPSEFLQGRASDIMGVQHEDFLVIPGRHEEINEGDDLRELVDKLRDVTGGVPIGVKMCASGHFEEDLEIVIRAGVDFISIDGGQAGTKGGAPILEDDFGLPTAFALPRAIRYLQERGVRERISILTGGGYTTPGQCLKALALGADAVYMGTALLWAMTHDQVAKTIPWEPPTELAFYPGKSTELLDEDKSAEYLENFFISMVEEMKLAIRALGKNKLSQLNPDDLIATDEWTSKVTNVKLANVPCAPGKDESPEAAIGSRNPLPPSRAKTSASANAGVASSLLYGSGKAAKQRADATAASSVNGDGGGAQSGGRSSASGEAGGSRSAAGSPSAGEARRAERSRTAGEPRDAKESPGDEQRGARQAERSRTAGESRDAEESPGEERRGARQAERSRTAGVSRDAEESPGDERRGVRQAERSRTVGKTRDAEESPGDERRGARHAEWSQSAEARRNGDGPSETPIEDRHQAQRAEPTRAEPSRSLDRSRSATVLPNADYMSTEALPKSAEQSTYGEISSNEDRVPASATSGEIDWLLKAEEPDGGGPDEKAGRRKRNMRKPMRKPRKL